MILHLRFTNLLVGLEDCTITGDDPRKADEDEKIICSASEGPG